MQKGFKNTENNTLLPLQNAACEDCVPFTPQSSPALDRRHRQAPSSAAKSPVAAESPLPLCSPGTGSPPPLPPNQEENSDLAGGSAAVNLPDASCPTEADTRSAGSPGGLSDGEDREEKGGGEERLPSPSSYSQSRETCV